MTGDVAGGLQLCGPVEHVQSDRRADEVMIDCPLVRNPAFCGRVRRQGRGSIAEIGLVYSRSTLQHWLSLVSTDPANRRPRVAVLATGDELLGVDEPLIAGRIRNPTNPC